MASSAFDSLWRELNAAEEQARPILRIRVTPDALRGTLAALPLTPERARQIRLRAYPSADGEVVVDADPETYLRALEIVIHPADWSEILWMLPQHTGFAISETAGVTMFMGIGVVNG